MTRGRPKERRFEYLGRHRELFAFIACFLDKDQKRGAQRRAFEAAAAKFGRSDTREIRRLWRRYAWMYHESTAAADFMASQQPTKPKGN